MQTQALFSPTTIGLISNDQFVGIGLALASQPLDQFVLFSKNRIGNFEASGPLRQQEPEFPIRYKKPMLNAKNYSLPENSKVQGFWLSVKPQVNKVQLLYPNFEPILLNLPTSWNGQPLKCFIRTKNRSSAKVATLDNVAYSTLFLEDSKLRSASINESKAQFKKQFSNSKVP